MKAVKPGLSETFRIMLAGCGLSVEEVTTVLRQTLAKVNPNATIVVDDEESKDETIQGVA